MSTVFVVVGEAGEYSDRSVWVAAACSTEQAAKDLVVEWDALSRALTAEFEAALRSAQPTWEPNRPGIHEEIAAFFAASKAINARHPDKTYQSWASYHYAEVELR